MKPKLVKCIRNPFRVPGFRSRTAALVTCFAIGASTAARLDAVVIDDFEDPARSATLWTSNVWSGTGGQTVTNGQVRIYVTPFGNHGFSFLQSVRKWTLQEGRTLEFRADLLGSNDDGAVAFFGLYLGDGNNGYRLLVDEDTLIMHKRSNPAFQCFFWTNGAPVKVSNVKLVVSMTGAQSGVLLKFRVLDNDSAGAVIFEREYWDTAAADPMQVGIDDPPGSYLGQSGYFYLGLYHDNAGALDPDVTLPHLGMAEVVFDNAEVLEYDVPSLQIANSVLLSWSEKTEEDQIVVMADSVTSTNWAPCPQPAFIGSGGLSVAVPITASQQFFKLAPGQQFVDSFSDTWGPFTNRSPWMPIWNDAGEEWFVTNGVLRLNWHAPASAGFLLAPLGTNVAARLRDFHTSVDLLDWVTSGTNWSVFSLGARCSMTTGGYLGGLVLHHSGVPPGSATLWIYNNSAEIWGPTFDMQQSPPPYRLQFSGVGTRLSLRVLNLTTGQLIREMNLTNSSLSTGWVALWIDGRNNVGDSFTATADNFLMTGTKP